MADITINLAVNSTTGAQPTAPAALNASLITLVAANNPGYTVLPAGLIEDVSSTITFGLALVDAAAVELINSITPYSSNPWLTLQLGAIYGVPQGIGSNTSVFVVFSGTVGFQINPGFLVSDGTNQYQVQEGAAIATGGSTTPVFCLATNPGSWPVPANSVTTLISSKPGGITLTVTNPIAGTPSTAAQTEDQYRAQVVAAGLVSGQGNASMCKSLLANVPGVQSRLVSVAQINGGGWEVIVGGGDPYAVADAITRSGVDISTLVGSTIAITGVTAANPGVATTNLNHGLITSQSNVHIAGALGMVGINGGPYTVVVLSPTTFSFGVNTSGFPAYTGGGIVTPNPRNVSVNINDYPNTYTIPFVIPPAQVTAIQLSWSTTSPNFVSATAVQQLGAPAIAAYVNLIPVGAPINIYAMEAAFVAAVVGLFNNNPALISKMTWTVSLNGVSTPPSGGTFLIIGDPESYFTCLNSAVTLTQV